MRLSKMGKYPIVACIGAWRVWTFFFSLLGHVLKTSSSGGFDAIFLEIPSVMSVRTRVDNLYFLACSPSMLRSVVVHEYSSRTKGGPGLHNPQFVVI